MKSPLRQVKRQIKQWGREPAWNPSKRTDQAALAEHVRLKLTGGLMAMPRPWRETRENIAQWRAAAEKLKPTRRRQARPPNPEFRF